MVALMIKKSLLFFTLFVTFFLSNQAWSSIEDKLGIWSRKVLSKTLSATWHDTSTEINEASKYYLPSAWIPMHAFFRDKLAIVKEKQLTLHPQLRVLPTVNSSNDCGRSPCWRVDLSYSLTQLQKEIDFSLLVMPAQQGSNTPFVIQSLNIIMKNI